MADAMYVVISEATAVQIVATIGTLETTMPEMVSTVGVMQHTVVIGQRMGVIS